MRPCAIYPRQEWRICAGAAPEEITIAAIVEAMEGPIAMTACVETSLDPCDAKNSCFPSGNWERVNSGDQQRAEGVTLAQMIDPEQLFIPIADADQRRPSLKRYFMSATVETIRQVEGSHGEL